MPCSLPAGLWHGVSAGATHCNAPPQAPCQTPLGPTYLRAYYSLQTVASPQSTARVAVQVAKYSSSLLDLKTTVEELQAANSTQELAKVGTGRGKGRGTGRGTGIAAVMPRRGHESPGCWVGAVSHVRICQYYVLVDVPSFCCPTQGVGAAACGCGGAEVFCVVVFVGGGSRQWHGGGGAAGLAGDAPAG